MRNGGAAAALAALAAALATCAQPPPDRSPALREPTFMSTTAVPTAAASGPIADRRPEVPGRFPLPAGARPAALDPDDPSMLGRWEVPTSGYDAYQFYVAELPRAGYPIEGLYPGGIGAIIRFAADDGIRQVYITGDLERTDVVLRTDQP